MLTSACARFLRSAKWMSAMNLLKAGYCAEMLIPPLIVLPEQRRDGDSGGQPPPRFYGATPGRCVRTGLAHDAGLFVSVPETLHGGDDISGGVVAINFGVGQIVGAVALIPVAALRCGGGMFERIVGLEIFGDFGGPGVGGGLVGLPAVGSADFINRLPTAQCPTVAPAR